MRRNRVALVLGSLMGMQPTLAQVQTFRNNYPGFLNATGPVSTIDFETLPDGSPSSANTPITSAYNYDLSGAHFTTPIGNPVIAGNAVAGFDLLTLVGNGQHTWIDATLTSSSHAVGVFFPGDATLCAFGEDGTQLGCVSYVSSGGPFFLGVVSSAPILRARIDSGTSSERIQSFLFAPVPEPATATMFMAGVLCVARRRRA